MGRLNALRKLEESPSSSDMDSEEIKSVQDILFKSDARWSIAYKELKSKYTWDKRAEAILGFYAKSQHFAERFKSRL